MSVRTERHFEPLTFRYTTDGTTPSARSPIYDGGRSFDASGTIRVQPSSTGRPCLQSATLTMNRHAAVGKAVALATPNSPTYREPGPFTLTDSLRGWVDFHDGTWQGWEGQTMDAVVDLGGVETVRAIDVGALQVDPFVDPASHGAWLCGCRTMGPRGARSRT